MILRNLLFLCFLMCLASASSNNSEDLMLAEPKRFEIISNQWEHVSTAFLVATWLLLAGLSKILFRLLGPLTQYFPDSSLLIVVGLGLGAFLKCTGVPVEYYTLDSHVFFIYLLPPIIFDAGYFMPNRAFFENFDSIAVLAIVCTTFNCFAIGLSLYALSWYDLFTIKFGLSDIYLFSSLISAVDPVAVIAVFEEIHVNDFLFVNVFGESLFNDAISVVLYNIFKTFRDLGSDNIQTVDYLAGFVSFFVVALGGVLLGVVFAFLVSLLTKYTKDKIVSAVLIFVVPYMCYLMAEWWTASSIIAIAVCGMVMKQYVKGNITQSTDNSIKYFVKILAQGSEAVVFMFVGLSVMSSTMYWDSLFVLFTVTFCLLYRTIGVLVLCAILNRFRKRKFENVDQFILAYSGLRGAIAYGMVVSMPDSVPAKPMFVTATIAVIYVTVFFQGSTIRPIINYLKIERNEHRTPTMAESVYNKYLVYAMSGLEGITGHKGQHTILETFERYNAKYIKPFLMRNEKKSDFDATKIVRAYAKTTLDEALVHSQQVMETEIGTEKRKTEPENGTEKRKTETENGTENGNGIGTRGTADLKREESKLDTHRIAPGTGHEEAKTTETNGSVRPLATTELEAGVSPDGRDYLKGGI